MFGWWLLLAQGSVAGPQYETPPVPLIPRTQLQVTIDYEVSFELDATGDAACRITKLCDCSAVYRGEGKRAQVAEDRISFKGTWTEVKSDCHENLEPWLPEDGKAFHTLRWANDVHKVSEWVVHADRDQHQRLTSNIKKGRQYWISDIDTAIDPESRAVTYVEKSEDKVSVFTIESTHELTLRFQE